ncbi:type I-F CRISPR-associated protein Csy3 [Actinobacillus pleuropneumoniae]|uniref:type I-F CRISPR-associated protein Csy3 n=1 Tax=Actinobacillus pleuropneumoniae TaxID=715 RepID=UPI003D0872F3
MTKLTTASVLAFERKLDISDATFTQKNSMSDVPEIAVTIRDKSVRGTISNRLKNALANDPAKLDSEIEKANLQRVDVTTLNDDYDTLVARFTCKVLPFEGKPNVCNDPEYQAKLLSTIQNYLTTHGMSELAKRYATNLVNARWLWRNRISAETIQVSIKVADDVVVFENAKQLPLNSFEQADEKLQKIASYIEKGLKGEEFIILEVEAQAKMGRGQEVYPSQELVLDTGTRKSKILYEINHKAGMHSQKIGNAIRTIDTWYAENAPFPIAAEPYGAVTNLGTAFRQPKEKIDFYTLFDNWVLKDVAPELEQQHYVISVLIRGGVFGASGKE